MPFRVQEAVLDILWCFVSIFQASLAVQVLTESNAASLSLPCNDAVSDQAWGIFMYIFLVYIFEVSALLACGNETRVIAFAPAGIHVNS